MRFRHLTITPLHVSTVGNANLRRHGHRCRPPSRLRPGWGLNFTLLVHRRNHKQQHQFRTTIARATKDVSNTKKPPKKKHEIIAAQFKPSLARIISARDRPFRTS
jgi:hypothetical protein